MVWEPYGKISAWCFEIRFSCKIIDSSKWWWWRWGNTNLFDDKKTSNILFFNFIYSFLCQHQLCRLILLLLFGDNLVGTWILIVTNDENQQLPKDKNWKCFSTIRPNNVCLILFNSNHWPIFVYQSFFQWRFACEINQDQNLMEQELKTGSHTQQQSSNRKKIYILWCTI